MRGDDLVEKGAERLRQLSERAAARGGAGEQLAQQLADDAVFLRKLKPSVVAARARGQAPTDEEPERVTVMPSVERGSAKRPRLSRGGSQSDGGGPNPLVIVAAALVVGMVLAKVIDWRSHAHPRD
ncbi:MAG: hypothetical protein M3123_05775 [Actinomycetota bacterium]|nr:hypothetical protein [Actinomycetota bacterium]